MQCPKCGRWEDEGLVCPDDGTRLVKRDWTFLALKILNLFAWINLIGGPVMAFIIYQELGKFGPAGNFWTGFAWGLFFESIIAWAILLVIRSIADNLIQIRYILSTQIVQRHEKKIEDPTGNMGA